MQRVELVGVVVAVQRRAGYVAYTLDDGSACVRAIKWHPRRGDERAPEHRIGDLARVRGSVSRFRGRREVSIRSSVTERDWAAEGVHWLEVARLHRDVYEARGWAGMVSQALREREASAAAAAADASAADEAPPPPGASLLLECARHVDAADPPRVTASGLLRQPAVAAAAAAEAPGAAEAAVADVCERLVAEGRLLRAAAGVFRPVAMRLLRPAITAQFSPGAERSAEEIADRLRQDLPRVTNARVRWAVRALVRESVLFASSRTGYELLM